MRDVAALAGVSMSTVSRVVNDQLVDAELARRVREAIALTGYRPNATASKLRRIGRQTSTAGLIIEDVSNPFFAAVQRGVEDVLRAHDVMCFASSTDEDPRREREIIEALAERDVDGLLIVPTTADQGYLSRLRDLGTPIVFLDRPPRFLDADVVTSDNRDAARGACEHLIAQGHRRIGMLGDRLGVHPDRPAIYTAGERLAGYREALERHGIAFDPELIRHSLHQAGDAYGAARDLLGMRDAPTAIFSSQNLISIEVVRALRELGLNHRVAFVGFDDVAMAAHTDPPTSVVAQQPRQIGRAAAELLIARLNGDVGPSRLVVVETTLIARGSGEIPAPTAQPD